MKRIMIAVSLAVLLFTAVSRSQTPTQTITGSPEQEVLDLFEDWMNAEVKADMAFIDRLLTEDWAVTDPVGNRLDQGPVSGGPEVRGGRGHILCA